MNFPTLSAHAEEFLALKRAVAKVDPHRNTQDRRSLKHREKLLRNFVAYWRDRGCPWPMRSSLVLDWIAVGSHRQHPYRDQRRFYVVALSCNRSAHSSPQLRYLRTSIDHCTAGALHICIRKTTLRV